MDITTILSDLLVIADSLEREGFKDVSADIDAALFIMSQETSLPQNKSLSSVVKENKASLENETDEQLEKIAIKSAIEIKSLMESVLQLDSVTMAAILKSASQSIRSVLDPNGALSPEVIKASVELLSEAEKKLLQNDELNGAGYRIEMIRGQIENG